MNILQFSYKCPEHPNKVICDICVSEDCNQRFLCVECRLLHHKAHFPFMQPLIQFLADDISKNLESNADTYLQMKSAIENFFLEKQQEISQSLVDTKNAMLTMLYQESGILNYEYVKSNYRSFNSRLFETSAPGNFEILKKKAIYHVEIQKSDTAIDSLKSTLYQELEKIQDSHQEMMNRLFTTTTTLKTLKPIQLPQSLDITRLWVGNSFDIEGRIFPQAIDIIHDRDAFVTGDSRGSLTLWNATNVNQIFSMKIHDNIINSVKYYSKKKLLFTCSKDCTIKVLKLNTILLMQNDLSRKKASQIAQEFPLKIIKTIYAHTQPIRSLIFIEYRNFLITAGNEPNIKIFDMKNFRRKSEINTKGRGDCGYQIKYINNKDLLAVGFKSGSISLYNLNDRLEMIRLETGIDDWYIDSIIYLENQDSLIASVSPKVLRKWTFGNKMFTESKEYQIPKGVETMIPFEGEEKILLGAMDSKVFCLNLNDGKITESIDTGLTKCVTILYLQKHRKFVVGDWKSHRMVVLHEKDFI